MLVLTRRPNESLVLTTPAGEVIEVRMLRIRGNQAHLGIQADKQVVIHRQEVLNRSKGNG